ncbi:MAG: sulfatase, partial [Planctomycetota bacterium]
LAAEGEDAEQTDGMVATRAIEMMRAHRDGPFFIAAGFFRPHTPYVAPKKYFDLYPPDAIRLPFAPAGDRDDIPVAAFAHNCPIPNYGLEPDLLREALQAYYASTSFVDAQVGRLLDAVDELGLTDETIVVFWSDHGYHLGEHDGVWQKRTLFEQGARAPLIVRVPGASGNGQVCRRVVEFLDIYPTVVDAAGLAVPGRVEGRSLVPLLNDPTAAWEEAAVTQILRPADDRLAQPVMGRSVRTERWRYTEWAEGAAGVELYDHHADPLEFEPLAGSAAARIAAVIERLRAILVTRASGSVPVTPFNPPRL